MTGPGAYDSIVRGGRVVLPGGDVAECDVAIDDGRIAALLGPGGGESGREVDARGLVVLPGVIDAHVHFGLGSPDDWATESVAAARGGVTTVLSYIQDAASYREVVPELLARAERESVIDFGLHLILMNDGHLAEVGDYVNELGIPSFKYFTNFRGREGEYLGVQGTDTGFFYELCRTVAGFPDAILAVHTENIEIVWRLAAQLQEAGRDDLRAWNESRPDLVEALDMLTAFTLAERTGCRMYIPHVASGAGVRAFEEHRARGGRAVIETCTHYLALTHDSELGQVAKVNPPVRGQADQDALWAAIARGDISVVGSDHNSRPRARKEGTIWKAAAGFAGVTTLLPIMLHEGHHERGLSLGRIAALLSEQPARIFGLYPRKGAIAVGADADLTLVDLDREEVVDGSAYGSNSDYSVYDGRSLRGWPVAAMVRGELVLQDGEVSGAAGHGRFLRRPIAAGAAEAARGDARLSHA